MAAATLESPMAPPGGDLFLPAHSSQLGAARRHVELIARAAGLDGRRAAHFVYAVNEAVTNAIRHGRPDRHGTIAIRSALEGGRLLVRVSDSGTFLPPAPIPAGEDAESGRGFALMARFADEVRLQALSTGTTVTLVACLA